MTDYSDKIEQFKQMAKYYGEKGEDALIKDIFANVVKQKQNGSLNNKQLVEFAEKIMPVLTPDQRKRLSELVTQLTEI